MPELPEVETIARGLHKRVAGDRIDSVWIGKKPEPLKSKAMEVQVQVPASSPNALRAASAAGLSGCALMAASKADRACTGSFNF